jgi:hypothetical protein
VTTQTEAGEPALFPARRRHHGGVSSWLIAAGIVGILLGWLGYGERGRTDLQGSLHDALHATPRPVDPVTTARGWMAYRYRNLLLYGGMISLVAGIVWTVAY